MMKIGTSMVIAHHGELVQGVFEDNMGIYRTGLVTVPYYQKCTKAIYGEKMEGGLVVSEDKILSKKAVEVVYDYFKMSCGSGELNFNTEIPVGKGYGSSTADICATIQAVSQALGKYLTYQEIFKLCARVEGASDSTILPNMAMLFDHTRHEVLRIYSKNFPKMHIVGFDSDIAQSVLTEKLIRPKYSSEEKCIFKLMNNLLVKGFSDQSVELLGRAATLSAEINQKYYPKKNFKELLEISKDVGANGIQISHSGTLIGLIFDDETWNKELSSYCEKMIQRLYGVKAYNFQLGGHYEYSDNCNRNGNNWNGV